MYRNRLSQVAFDTDNASASRSTVPPESPLDMPSQTVDRERTMPAPETDGRWRLGVICASALTLTTFATMQLFYQVAPGGVTFLEGVALFVFCFNFLWISAASSTAAAGAFVMMTRKRLQPLANSARFKTKSRTAIIVPLYNERTDKAMGGVEAIWSMLKAQGSQSGFEIFFLSDTKDPAVIATEEAGIADLRKRRPGDPIWYRRRTDNKGKKGGNIEEFVRRWGGRYDYMVEFDADSLMSPAAMIELVRRMDANPRIALIQTLSLIHSPKTLSARMQAFALRAYGTLFATGMAWWSGGAGNFWGHNAIIRVAPFAQHAKLPDLPGKLPLGGPILSHDFVEASLLRRAGYRIEIAPEIEGSYEECPPTLVDVGERDRRWAQGNLQQVQLIFAKGFDWVTRGHLVAGVMGYISSFLWITTIVTNLAISIEAELTHAPLTPPHNGGWWGSIPPFLVTAIVVLSPKWLTLVTWVVRGLPGFGRKPRFLLQVLVESVLSAVSIPIMIVSQAGAVVSTLLGNDVGWKPQVRERDGFSLADLVRRYWTHIALAGTILACSLAVSPNLALAALPLMAGPLVAPIAVALMAKRISDRSLLSHLLATPEDRIVPDVVRNAERHALAMAKGERPERLSVARRSRLRPGGRRQPRTATG